VEAEEMNWRPLRGYAGKYEVSDCGTIRTCAGRVLKSWLNDQGYELARVSGPRKVLRVHRVVAEAFVPNPDSLPFVNHINCSRSSNNATNLEWCTQWQNLNHSQKLGRMQRDYWLGKRSPSAKLSNDQVAQIKAVYSNGGLSLEAVGRLFNVSKRTVGRIISGESYV
jgi:hypothetical protein